MGCGADVLEGTVCGRQEVQDPSYRNPKWLSDPGEGSFSGNESQEPRFW